MAKKKTVKKKIDRSKTTAKSEVNAALEIIGTLLLIAGLTLGGMYICDFGPFDSSIKRGQCYLNKAFETVKVTGAYKTWDEVEFRYVEVKPSHIFKGEYYLSTDFYRSSFTRDFKFVKDNYTLIKCASND